MDLSDIGRWLLAAAAVIAVVGLVLLAGGALGLGRLPGDFRFGAGPVRVYAPIATCIVLSIVATIILNLVMRR